MYIKNYTSAVEIQIAYWLASVCLGVLLQSFNGLLEPLFKISDQGILNCR